jgi:glycosyltransferase involved in cell wall biosynthesis
MMRASVVLSTYNRADILNGTLASIFRQQVPFDYEVIVVDDGSSDHTTEVLSRYPVVTERIERPEGHRNPAYPRNRAIALASSDILIMQSDDVWHETAQTIEELTNAATAQPNAAFFATVYNVNADGVVIDTFVHPRTRRRALFFLGAIHKSRLCAIGGNDEAFTEAGYEDAWLRDCLQHGAQCPFVFLSGPVAHHQDHTRPSKDYGTQRGTKAMRKLYKHKCTEASRGAIPWRAEISSLYAEEYA